MVLVVKAFAAWIAEQVLLGVPKIGDEIMSHHVADGICGVFVINQDHFLVMGGIVLGQVHLPSRRRGFAGQRLVEKRTGYIPHLKMNVRYLVGANLRIPFGVVALMFLAEKTGVRSATDVGKTRAV